MVVLDLREGVDPVRELTLQMLERAGRPDLAKPYGVYFLPSDSPYSPLARFVEREVFLQRFGNDDLTMDEEYGPFERCSDFVLCVDHFRLEPTGVMRVIRPGPEGLKTLHDVESEPRWGVSLQRFLDIHRPEGGINSVHDVATFAVRGGWTESATAAASSHALYAGLYRWSVAAEVELLVAAIDEIVASLLRALRIPLEPLCGLPAIEYLGSEATRPYVISIPDATRLTREDEAFRSLMSGEEVERDYSFPPLDLSTASSLDLQTENRVQSVDESSGIAAR